MAGAFIFTADFDPGPGKVDLTSDGPDNGFIAKYSSDGQLIFVKQLAATRQSIAGMALDSTGNIYLAGNFSGTLRLDGTNNAATFNSLLNGQDIYLVSFDGSGAYRFGRQIASPSAQTVQAFVITPAGELYLAGNFVYESDFDPGPDSFLLRSAGEADIFLAKYDAYGNFISAKSFGGRSLDDCLGIALDIHQNVLMTGYFTYDCDFGQGDSSGKLTSRGFFDIYLAKFDSSGKFHLCQTNRRH